MKRYLFALAFCVVFASTASAVEVYQWTYDDVQIAKICGKNVACAEWARNILYEQCDAHRVDKKWFNPDFIIGDTRVFATVEECRHMWVDDLPNTPAVRSWRFRQNTPDLGIAEHLDLSGAHVGGSQVQLDRAGRWAQRVEIDAVQ
jgi:hypothetical protein